MNIQGLIERYEKFKASKKKMTSVGLVLKDLRSLDEPEPLPFKLKDVVRRIRGFDPTTQTRWLNDILKELGDDYGSMKYRSGYEQGKLEGMVEREKIKVPQFIAEFITEQKKLGHTLSYSIDASMSDRVAEWYWDNSELFARAWLDGYEVEEEKKYKITLLNRNDGDLYLVNQNANLADKYGHFSPVVLLFTKSTNFSEKCYKLTKKDVVANGFGWIFFCPGIEIEEVE
jgi:hypothetical protein|nr:MAG TPA: Protein of unknown function (DUF1642) [Caudoviricetes sp.]